MSIELETWSSGATARLGALAAHASLQPEFESLLGEGLGRMMGDAFNREDCRHLATIRGEDAGFGYALLVPTADGPFAAYRIGVLERFRRLGVATALHAAMRVKVAEVAPEIHEHEMGAFLPAPAAEAFATRHGFSASRAYWLMERPPVDLPEPVWPVGISIRRFDASDDDVRLWVAVFNAAWREHHHPILATFENIRRDVDGGRVDPKSVYFAVRGGTPVGFVRGALLESRGEVAVLGVVPEARGLGLGRALLRFGGRWLIEHGARRVTLYVDGENERALRLYRQEGYEVIRTRRLWSRQD